MSRSRAVGSDPMMIDDLAHQAAIHRSFFFGDALCRQLIDFFVGGVHAGTIRVLTPIVSIQIQRDAIDVSAQPLRIGHPPGAAVRDRRCHGFVHYFLRRYLRRGCGGVTALYRPV